MYSWEFTFPRPWKRGEAPVVGNTHGHEANKCVESKAFSVLDVITDLDVLEV